MKTEFEVNLRGRTEASVASLEQIGNVWVFESDEVSCTAFDVKTALTGALGLAVGIEMWNSENLNNDRSKEIMATERGSYFDIWERGEYSIDPRDLKPFIPPVEFGSAGVLDREAFDLYFGSNQDEPIYPISETVETVEEVVLIAV